MSPLDHLSQWFHNPKGQWNRSKALGECVLCEIASFRLHHWPWLQHVNVKGQWHSQVGPNASNEKCTMGRVLFRIKYYYNDRKYVTLIFDIWPWPFPLIFDLEIGILLPWCFEDKIANFCFDITWRKNGTSYVNAETTDLKFLQWTFCNQPEIPRTSDSKVMAQFVFLYDWCKFRSDKCINSGDIAHCLHFEKNRLKIADFRKSEKKS